MRGPTEHDRIPAESPRSSHQNAPTRARARSNRFSSIAAIRPDDQNPRSGPYDPERLRNQMRRPPILPVNQTNETHTNLLPAGATPLPPYPHLSAIHQNAPNPRNHRAGSCRGREVRPPRDFTRPPPRAQSSKKPHHLSKFSPLAMPFQPPLRGQDSGVTP